MDSIISVSVSLEKAKSAFLHGNYSVSQEYLTYLRKQLYVHSNFDSYFDEFENLLSGVNVSKEKESKNKVHDKGLKLLKKIRKGMKKQYSIKGIKDLKYDTIMRREELIQFLNAGNSNNNLNTILVKQKIFATDFKIFFASEREFENITNGNTQINHANEYKNNLKFYSHDYSKKSNSNINKEKSSFMAIAVDGEGNHNGVISTATSDFNIVKHVDDTHLMYKEEKKYHCSVTPEFTEKHSENISQIRERNATETNTQNKLVKVWMETAYDVLEYFRKMGAENPKESMINYVMTLFNIVKTIYANEKVEILLQGIYVWDIQDPFGARDSADVLDKYQKYRNVNKWEGNLAHLLSFEHGKGSAIAFVDVLCAREYAYGFTWMQKHSNDIQNPSSKNPGTAPVTSYSWNSSTIAHEMGHCCGLNHTFNCCWYRDGLPNQSLGGAPYVEGFCKIPPRNLPTGLTIMGYESDYPMTNGFGQQPGDLLRKKVAECTCI